MSHPTATVLGRYLDSAGITPAAFARQVGANRSQIYRLATGERGVGGLLALAIERETRGAVKAAEVLRSRRAPKRRRNRAA